MKAFPINKNVVKERLSIIEEALERLEKFKSMEYKAFAEDDTFAICEHYLRRALEAVLDIGSHILSRIPGARPQTYKDIPKLLGKHKIVPLDFAEGPLLEMAGYRNRLIHFYNEITKEELFDIIKNHLQDIERFCRIIIKLIE